jgi:tetratricopeptide (TPR) repeat protein
MSAFSTRAFPLLAKASGEIALGRYEEASRTLIEHLRRHPGEPRGLSELGYAAMLIGALGQSEAFLRKALAVGARDLETRRRLASVIHQQQRLVEAEGLFAALAAETGDDALLGIRADILDKLGRHSEALAIYDELVMRNPKAIRGWIAAGHTRRSAGRVEEAIAAYRQAISIEVDCGDAWWGLAGIKSKVLTDHDVETMRGALKIAVDERNISPLHFALGRALHDRQEYEGAFAHYAEGNRLRAESIGYDAQELTDEIDEVEARVTAAAISRFPGAGPENAPTPIFIVSLPRSGSTLLEQMLGSHDQVEAVGELPYVPALLRSFLEIVTRRANVSVVEAVLDMPEDLARRMGADYLRRVATHRRTDRAYFIDKLPHNWSNLLFIRRILPHARFVDIRRPAMDCCFSNFTQSFTRAHAPSFRLEDIARCYRDYVRFMDHLDRIAPQLVSHVDYTALITDARSQVGTLLRALDLPWDDSVLNFHKLDRVVRTPSSEQVRRPLNRDGMEVWRPYEQWLGPLREQLGALIAK